MLKILRRIVQEVGAAPNLQGALDVAVAHIKNNMSADICSVYLLDKNSNEYVLMSTDGIDASYVGVLRFASGEGLVGFVGEREEPLNLDDAVNHPAYQEIVGQHDRLFSGFVGVPIIHHRHPMGVLVVRHKDPRHFDDQEEAFLVTIAAQLAGAIAHAERGGDVDLLLAHQGITDQAFEGLPGAPGVGVGTVIVAYPSADLDAVPQRKAKDIEKEIRVFKKAVNKAKTDLETLSKQLEGHVSAEDQALFHALALMLEGEGLVGRTIEHIRTGCWASGGLKLTIEERVKFFNSIDDPYLRERASDIRDLGQRILMHIQSGDRQSPPYPKNTVLVGEEISATMLVDVPRDRLVAIVSARGSALSHVAILAKAMGVPAVVGIENLPITRLDWSEMIVDGYRGRIYVSPSPVVKREYQRLAKEEEELSADLEALRDLPTETTDGHRVLLYANTGLVADLVSSKNSGAEGIGLYRTEFPFMVRDRFPVEEEQRRIYKEVLEAFAPKTVVLRTLDIGGDKSLPYFPIEEENPFLGWRGIRVTLDHPEIFLVQLRAMLKASANLNNLRILFPMISCESELDEALALVERAYAEIVSEGIVVTKPQLGVMIEVPSMLYLMDRIAPKIDFFSIGTNDLTQYLLAVDRNNTQVAPLYDGLQPAVLKALQHVVERAHAHKKSVSVCGELAGDPTAVIVLLGMGVDCLSMSAASLLRVKWVLRSFSYKESQSVLAEVLELSSANDVRARLESLLVREGLGGLVRAGNK
ncbi:FIG001592: Phosphocarrier protein kinase/phosphorylase, nitrogen regulation associated [hydrothermal vent metagenome]|uniref:phosphoenolpyruvate--protein phosphotransferase n=1 Tax=hydrothermal vent metagenome TaxID=652676 RepID=A0A3B1A3Y8_9ZZZZ